MYEIDSFGNQIYPPSDDGGGEKYLKNGKFEFMAKKRDSSGNLYPYFASDREGNPICPYLKENMEYLELNIPYPKRGNKEIYPKRDNKEYYIGQNENCKYALDETRRRYYAKSENGYYYAFQRIQNGDLIDFPIDAEQRKPKFIITRDSIRYPVNWTKRRVLYPIDSDGNEYYLEKEGTQYYGIFPATSRAPAMPKYAKNKFGDAIFAIHANYPYYAFCIDPKGKKREYYPRNKEGQYEHYLKKGGREIYAKYGVKEYYAHNEIGDYLARDRQNISYYARDADNNEFYPSTYLGKNIYRVKDKIERIAITTSNKGFYARDESKNEFYPRNYSLS